MSVPGHKMSWAEEGYAVYGRRASPQHHDRRRRRHYKLILSNCCPSGMWLCKLDAVYSAGF